MDTEHEATPEEYTFGEYVFFPRSRKVVGPLGHSVKLTRQQNQLLVVLAANIGKVVAKEDLYLALYANTGTTPDPKILEVLICKIRTLLTTLPHGDAGHHVVTIRGHGYMLSHAPNANRRMTGHRGTRDQGVRRRLEETVLSLRAV